MTDKLVPPSRPKSFGRVPPRTPPETAPVSNGDTCWVSELRCPRCGCAMNTNGRLVWCSLVGGGGEKGCDYGMAENVTYEEAQAAGARRVLPTERPGGE